MMVTVMVTAQDQVQAQATVMVQATVTVTAIALVQDPVLATVQAITTVPILVVPIPVSAQMMDPVTVIVTKEYDIESIHISCHFTNLHFPSLLCRHAY